MDKVLKINCEVFTHLTCSFYTQSIVSCCPVILKIVMWPQASVSTCAVQEVWMSEGLNSAKSVGGSGSSLKLQ